MIKVPILITNGEHDELMRPLRDPTERAAPHAELKYFSATRAICHSMKIRRTTIRR